MREHNYFVYILTNCSRHPLYTGVTNSLSTRCHLHKNPEPREDSYTSRYALTRLVYFERFQYINDAISREKQIKGWSRAKKIALIENVNPAWDDLTREFGKVQPLPSWSGREENQGPSARTRNDSPRPRSG